MPGTVLGSKEMMVKKESHFPHRAYPLIVGDQKQANILTIKQKSKQLGVSEWVKCWERSQLEGPGVLPRKGDSLATCRRVRS